MSYFQQINQLKEQSGQAYMQNYWGQQQSLYGGNSGKFVENDAGKVVYTGRGNELPSLQQLWSQFQKGASSRGLKANYLTFKNNYDMMKKVQDSQYLGHLQNAEMRGIPLDKIHDALQEDPKLRNKLITAAGDGSAEGNQFISHYNPERDTSIGDMIKDKGWLAAPLLFGGKAAYDFGMSPTKEAKTIYDASKSKSQKLLDEAKKKRDTAKGKEARAKKPETKAQHAKDVKTHAKDVKKYKTQISKIKQPPTRWSARKWFKPGGGGMGGYGDIAAYVAPGLLETGLKKAGVKDKEAEIAGDVAGTAGGGYLLTRGILGLIQNKANPAAWMQVAGGLSSLYGVGKEYATGLFSGDEPDAEVPESQTPTVY